MEKLEPNPKTLEKYINIHIYEESTLSSIVAAGYTLKLNWKIQDATGTVHFPKVKPNLYAVWSRQFIKTKKKKR